MIHWEAHACLPLHPQASFAPIERFREAGVHYVSVNIGMDMNPLSQVMQTIAGFRASIAAQPDSFIQAHGIKDIERALSVSRATVRKADHYMQGRLRNWLCDDHAAQCDMPVVQIFVKGVISAEVAR